MHYTWVVAIQSAYISFSLILYFLIFIYIMWSGDPEFKTAFHRLFLLRAPADFIQVLVSLFAFRFPIVGWEEVTYIPHLAKMGFMISQYSVLVEMCAQLLLSINRLSAIVYPIQHNKFWTKKITLLLFLSGMILAIIPTASRASQPAAYIHVNGSFIPFLIDAGDQENNSKVTCIIYIFFCFFSLLCNMLACFVHRKQKRMQFFETQPKLASTVQTNLLIYACLSTVIVLAMTCFQSLLAFHVFDLSAKAYQIVLWLLTVSADAFALSNPWLLFCLSSTFRHKFLEARKIRRIFAAAPSTIETS
ncbi:Serpentine receptor class gamma [Caenorhabditis elegans]|uniref:Serpentine receptor class gamma n=1 Tax=Caenorhabditis elegans TaxID=6239 RepID=Q86GC5_CAEEL|nr:Serpentine receptor class gamma [Caenorhabditis elegans]CAD60413.1 Serpentine receptor class gamma [Caenorhabditis elegans]|eukprot:NP_872061.1 Serpentine receptor class gamma [Caenorhabditis elegans]